VLRVDSREVALSSMEHSTPITFPEDETVDIGQDTRTGVAMVSIATIHHSSSPVRSTNSPSSWSPTK